MELAYYDFVIYLNRKVAKIMNNGIEEHFKLSKQSNQYKAYLQSGVLKCVENKF